MREFFIGLLVIIAVLLLAGLGVVLFPLLLVLGLALRVLILILIGILAVWLVGKLTLSLIEAFRKKEEKPS